jgi:type IV secretory pathway TraG/TraD family ATPase VirD4
VFNPCGLGGRPSTVTFDPLDGCTSPTIAAYRAADLIAGAEAPGQGHGGDREFWTTQATRVLKALLHAAALGDRNMRDVLRWVADPEAASQEALAHLHGSSESAIAENALQFFTMNERTRTSVTSTIMPALSWLDDADAAAAAGQPSSRPVVITEDGVSTPPPPASLDVEELISRRGTVYLLGAHDAQVAPLVTALTGHIARVARDMASRMPAGRLDPPLTFALDEAALICPIPLDEWTADMGGRNITIHIAAQSLPQLRKRWGDNGASAILNNAATVLLFGGTRDPADLDGWAKLIGERDEHVRSYDADGKVTGTSVRRVPVLEASLIANLPERKVVIIRRGMPPAVGRVQWAWKLRAVRVANRTPKPVPAAASTAAEWSPTVQVETANTETDADKPREWITGPAEPGASTA